MNRTAERIAALRLEKGLTQEDLADLLAGLFSQKRFIFVAKKDFRMLYNDNARG